MDETQEAMLTETQPLHECIAQPGAQSRGTKIQMQSQTHYPPGVPQQDWLPMGRL